jgi:hypothetical protein
MVFEKAGHCFPLVEWISHSLPAWPRVRQANVKCKTPLETYIFPVVLLILTFAKVAAERDANVRLDQQFISSKLNIRRA